MLSHQRGRATIYAGSTSELDSIKVYHHVDCPILPIPTPENQQPTSMDNGASREARVSVCPAVSRLRGPQEQEKKRS